MLTKGYRGLFYVAIVSILFSFGFPTKASAAILYFSPSSVVRSVGQSFSAIVKVNSEGADINAAQATVTFDAAKLEVTSVSKSGSIFNLWTSEPSYSNSNGTVNFEGGLPTPGYSGSSGTILTINFKVKTNSNSTVSLTSGAVLANDGSGTNVISGLGKLTVSVTQGQTIPQPTKTPAIAPAAPIVSSSSNPDQNKWYSSSNPQFAWNLPAGVTDVSYIISDQGDTDPSTSYSANASSAKFYEIPDGTHYFHIKYKINGLWSQINHFKFNIDSKPPLDFTVRVVNDSSAQPQITFTTTDDLSGIDHYEVKIDDQDWEKVSADNAGTPYPVVYGGKTPVTVLVKAIDAAGNSRQESVPVTIIQPKASVTISWGPIFGILAVIFGLAIIIYLLWLIMGKGKKKNEKPGYDSNYLVHDIQGDLNFLNSVDQYRGLSQEELYMRSKLQRYLHQLGYDQPNTTK